MSTSFSNPSAIAEQGEKIYKEQYKEAYERDHLGKFVAIDVTTGKAYIADAPEVAMEEARTRAPSGIFHLIQVGHAAAFRLSCSSDAAVDWIFR